MRSISDEQANRKPKSARTNQSLCVSSWTTFTSIFHRITPSNLGSGIKVQAKTNPKLPKRDFGKVSIHPLSYSHKQLLSNEHATHSAPPHYRLLVRREQSSRRPRRQSTRRVRSETPVRLLMLGTLLLGMTTLKMLLSNKIEPQAARLPGCFPRLLKFRIQQTVFQIRKVRAQMQILMGSGQSPRQSKEVASVGGLERARPRL